MRIKFSFQFVDEKGNSTHSLQKFHDIKVNISDGRERVNCSVKKSIFDNSIRPDDSLCIVWQVEYSNTYCLKALPYYDGDNQLKVRLIY